MATHHIINIDDLGVEIGPVTFVVPESVRDEVKGMLGTSKGGAAKAAMRRIASFEVIPVRGRPADSGLVEHAREHHCIIGTMDRELKRRVKEAGGSVMSFWNDRIVLEP